MGGWSANNFNGAPHSRNIHLFGDDFNLTYSGNNKIGIAQQDDEGSVEIYLGVNRVNRIFTGLNVLGANVSSTGIAETVQEIHASD
jgi:hypothetical protein